MSNITIGLMKKLSRIQGKMHVGKNQANKFAGFNFRNIGDILEKLKPLLEKENLFLHFRDGKIDLEKEMYYLNLVICDLDSKDENIEYCQFEGEIKIDMEKKQMDKSQKVLCAKTFLKKSLLEDLFCIDEDDPDSLDNTNQQKPVEGKQPVESKKPVQKDKKQDSPNQDQLKRMFAILGTKGISQDKFKKSLGEQYKVKSSKDLTLAQYESVCKYLESLPDKPKVEKEAKKDVKV